MRFTPAAAHRRAHHADGFQVRQSRRHQRVGPSRLVGFQPLDRVIQLGPPAQEVFRPPGQRERKGQRYQSSMSGSSLEAIGRPLTVSPFLTAASRASAVATSPVFWRPSPDTSIICRRPIRGCSANRCAAAAMPPPGSVFVCTQDRPALRRQQAMPALRLRGELRTALGAAALDFGCHVATPRAWAISSNVLPSSARTAARPVNFDRSPVCGATRSGPKRHVSCSRRFMASLPRGSRRPISKRQNRWSTICDGCKTDTASSKMRI
jgi:hypothetical protein